MSKVECVSMYLTAIHIFFFYASSPHIIFPLKYCIVDLFLSILGNSLYIKDILSMMSIQIFFLCFFVCSYSKIYDLWGFLLLVKAFPRFIFYSLMSSSSREFYFLCLSLGSIHNLFYCTLWKNYQHYFFQMVTQLSLHYLWDNSLCS